MFSRRRSGCQYLKNETSPTFDYLLILLKCKKSKYIVSSSVESSLNYFPRQFYVHMSYMCTFMYYVCNYALLLQVLCVHLYKKHWLLEVDMLFQYNIFTRVFLCMSTKIYRQCGH